ncbi:MAG: hypothetical protein IT428_00205 [Planctomycetaceae bacterium]|nr:hypothetical protein [Planctomycetaceae bacterium]
MAERLTAGLAALMLLGGSALQARDDGDVSSRYETTPKNRSLAETGKRNVRTSSDRWAHGSSESSATRRSGSKVERADMVNSEDRPARVIIDEMSEPPTPYGSENLVPKAKKPAPRTSAGSRVRQVQAKVEDDNEKPEPKPEAKPDEKLPENVPETLPNEGKSDPAAANPYKKVTSPAQLKRVTAILPFQDYEPDPEIARLDPCRNLCPRPGDCGPNEAHLCPEELWEGGAYVPRMFDPSCFTWTATNLWYNPLYFEDVQLERYGHTYCPLIQPAVSVGKFGVQFLFLPYQIAMDPPCKKEYALGYYRPGDCAPKLCYQPPLSVRGGLAQAGVVTGLFFIIP